MIKSWIRRLFPERRLYWVSMLDGGQIDESIYDMCGIVSPGFLGAYIDKNSKNAVIDDAMYAFNDIRGASCCLVFEIQSGWINYAIDNYRRRILTREECVKLWQLVTVKLVCFYRD